MLSEFFSRFVHPSERKLIAEQQAISAGDEENANARRTHYSEAQVLAKLRSLSNQEEKIKFLLKISEDGEDTLPL